MINKNKDHLMCFLPINSMFPLKKQTWGWAYLFIGQKKFIYVRLHVHLHVHYDFLLANSLYPNNFYLFI
jgi:hypothetical protein